VLSRKRILIYSYAGLGDTILFTPSLRKIKQLYPDCTISFITKTVNHHVLKGLSYIDNVYPFDRGNFFKNIRLVFPLANQDYIFVADWNSRLILLTKILCHPHISVRLTSKEFKDKTSRKHSSAKFANRHIKKWVLDTQNYAADTINNALSYALNIPIAADTENIDVTLPNEKEIQKVNQLMQDNGLLSTDQYICLSPFTSFEPRNWPLEHARKLVNLIQNNLHIPVIILGPPSKIGESQKIGGINLVGKTSFGEMVEFLRRAKLCIGPDSGTMHVAGAIDAPQIALFSNDFPSRWAPKKKNCRVVSLNLPCIGCRNEGITACSTRLCNNGVTPEMVFKITKEELNRIEMSLDSNTLLSSLK